MRELLTGRGAAAIGGALAALLVAGGGYAIATGAPGTINACVHKHGGGIYLGRCARHDRKLSWNTVGPQGLPGPPGQPGPAGSAVAYANVLWDGTTASFNPAFTSGMGSATVRKQGVGGFCIGNLPFTPHNATVSVEFGAAASDRDTATVQITPPGSPPIGCAAGETVRVETVDPIANTETPQPFYITFN